MKSISFALMLLCSYNAHSSLIDLKIDSQIKRDGSTRDISINVAAELGQEFIVPLKGSDNLKMRLTATEFKSNPESDAPVEVMFSMLVLDTKNGEETVIAHPKVITAYNTKASISMDDPSKDQSFFLSIIPTKK